MYSTLDKIEIYFCFKRLITVLRFTERQVRYITFLLRSLGVFNTLI